MLSERAGNRYIFVIAKYHLEEFHVFLQGPVQYRKWSTAWWIARGDAEFFRVALIEMPVKSPFWDSQGLEKSHLRSPVFSYGRSCRKIVLNHAVTIFFFLHSPSDIMHRAVEQGGNILDREIKREHGVVRSEKLNLCRKPAYVV